MKIAAHSHAQITDKFLSIQNKANTPKELAEKTLTKDLSHVQNIKTRVGDDAVRVKLTDDSRELSRPEAYNRARRIDRPEKVDRPESVFTPGKPIVGKYADGQFKTESGFEGSYYGLPGGQIGFEVEGFKGILAPSGKAIAVNPESGEAYAMEIKYRNGNFKVSGVREINPRALHAGNKEPLLVENKSENVSFRYDDAGNLAVKISNPETGETITGQGYLSPNGIYSLALDNGTSVFGAYQFGEDGLEIFNRRAFK